MHMCTKFSADWNIVRYRSGSNFVFVTDSQTQKIFCHWSFRSPEGLKSLQKNVQVNLRRKVSEFGYHNTYFGPIKI